MKRSSCSCSLWGGLRGGLVAAALASLLGGCSLTDDIFGSGPGNNEPSATPEPVPGPAAGTTPQTNQTTQGQPTAGQTAQTAQGQAYPNLGTVPQQAPATTSSADRQQLASGLVADNQNAAYSDQPVTATQESGTPAPAPIPPPVPAPAAAPAATGSDASTVSVTPVPAPAPAPQPQPTSQATVGQTVTNQASTAQTTSTPPAPAASVVQLPATPPATTGGATPMAPPPNPIPASPAPTMMASTGAVSVDNSQLAGSPLAGYPPVPGSAPGYASAYAPAYGSAVGAGPSSYAVPAGAAPVAGQPVAVIFFTESSAALSDRAQWVLQNVHLLQQQQGGRLRIVGNASLHTVTMDPQRHDQVNYRISQSRANAVARALINMGVPQGSIGVAAQGSQAPIFYEFMPTGEAANRRVEIYLDR